jgi:lipid A 3-O-deacylase
MFSSVRSGVKASMPMGLNELRFLSLSIAVIAVAVWQPQPVLGQEALDRTSTINVTEENDSIGFNSDKHYTQGARFSYASAESTSGTRVSIADSILFAGKNSEFASTYRYSVYFGQSLFTPENLELVTPDPNDRPYAGWLYVGMDLYRETPEVLDRAEVTVGIVGPSAQGRETQNDYHHLTRAYLGGRPALGWGAQLHDEPGLILAQERKWRIPGHIGGLEADLLPEVNASLGNIFTYAGAGFLARVGQRIAVDWGPPRVQPGISGTDFVNRSRLDGRPYAWYVFAGTEARLVARNIFLDGNSFEDSASVSKEPLVADLTAGFAMVFPRGRAAVSYVRRTDEFKTQVGQDQFLSITLAILF